MSRLEYLFKQYENILGWYRQAEEKAKFLVTINTLVVGVVNGLVFIGADKARSVRPLHTAFIWILLVLTGIALTVSFVFVLRAVWPRHHGRDGTLKHSERMWFFGDIASLTRPEYEAVIAGWNEADLERTMVAQSHILSRNVWAKHQALNWAIACTVLAVILVLGLGVAYGNAVANAPLPSEPMAR